MVGVTLQLCIKINMSVHVFLITEGSGAGLPYLQCDLILVDTVFIKVKLAYNIMERTK